MMTSLVVIQNELKAPKNNYNSFGRYKYRSCESILENLKPLLEKYACQLTLSDEIIAVADRVYVKATATLTDPDGNTEVTTAFARESLEKKGMDDSQVTGTASSYARKYALNGMFLIDDTKDADTNEYHDQTHGTERANDTDRSDRRINAKEIAKLKTAILQSGKTVAQALKAAKCDSIEEMTLTQYRWILSQCA